LFGNAKASSGEARNPDNTAAVPVPTTNDSRVSRLVSTSTARLLSFRAVLLTLLIRGRPEKATVDEMLAKAIVATRRLMVGRYYRYSSGLFSKKLPREL
jgi:hypothetical protein